jgi:hypothetical protein
MTTRKSDDIQIAHDENQDLGYGAGQETYSKAVEFLAGHSSEQPDFTYEEEKAVLRRIDLRVLILVLWAYFFQQLDKSTLRYLLIQNFCQVQTLIYLLSVMSRFLESPMMPTWLAFNIPGLGPFCISPNW